MALSDGIISMEDRRLLDEKSQELNSARTEKPTNVNLLFTCAHE